jgi:hypothetical protein
MPHSSHQELEPFLYVAHPDLKTCKELTGDALHRFLGAEAFNLDEHAGLSNDHPGLTIHAWFGYSFLAVSAWPLSHALHFQGKDEELTTCHNV